MAYLVRLMRPSAPKTELRDTLTGDLKTLRLGEDVEFDGVPEWALNDLEIRVMKMVDEPDTNSLLEVAAKPSKKRKKG